MACLITLRRTRVGRPRSPLILFAVYGRFLYTNLAAQCYAFSRSLIWVVVCGLHIGEAYSSFGRTSML